MYHALHWNELALFIFYHFLAHWSSLTRLNSLHWLLEIPPDLTLKSFAFWALSSRIVERQQKSVTASQNRADPTNFLDGDPSPVL
jgi:hypothetical protein